MFGEDERKTVKCMHCEYTWNTRSRLSLVTCPSCLGKTKAEGENE